MIGIQLQLNNHEHESFYGNLSFTTGGTEDDCMKDMVKYYHLASFLRP
jgi:hypothetical protein